MRAKLVGISNNSAIVVYEDHHEVIQACIVNSSSIPVKRIGEEFDMTRSLLINSTPYGIDMSVVYPKGIVIDIKEFQRRLYDRGVIALHDLKTNPSVINHVLISMVNAVSAEIYYEIKKVMEDYNDSI